MPPGVAKSLASQPIAQGLMRGGRRPTDGVSRSVLVGLGVRQLCRALQWTVYSSTGKEKLWIS
jgi:hypothetical protein